MPELFKGIFAALTTPFENHEISPSKLKKNLEKYNLYELQGYVVAGSTGEGAFLTDDECSKLIETARPVVPKNRTLIAGTARASTQGTLNLTLMAADAGADAALIVLPHYFKSKMTTAALKTHFITIADKSPIPLIIYSIPQNTGIFPSPGLFIELSTHPNIAGVKDSSGNLAFFGEVFPKMAQGSAYLLGAGSLILPGLLMGASGGILAMAAVVPDLMSRLYRLYLSKQWDEAFKLQSALTPLNQAVTAIHGVAAAKYALDLLGWHGGECRLPLLPLENEAKQEIKNLLFELELLSAPGP